MNQLGAFVVLLGIAGVVLAALGALVGWWNAETRRIRRGLRKVLRAEPHAIVVAPGRGRGAGFNFTSNEMAVAWDSGGWCLIYRIDELVGAELLIDGKLAARSWRGEARRPLETAAEPERQVTLRLVFDDPHHPDFGLELWTAADRGRRRGLTAADALEQGARWLARTDSVFRRNPIRSAPLAMTRPPPAPEPVRQLAAEPAAASPAPTAAEPPAPATGVATAAPIRQELPFDGAAPWEDEEGDEEAVA